MYDKSALVTLVREKALKFGDFTLASGKKASFYLDCRRITLDSRGANLIAEGILELLGDQLPDALGGMAIGADPITAAVITVAGQQNRPLKGFIVRKEAKAHGKGRDVEGPVQPGDTAMIVEDVVTTGASNGSELYPHKTVIDGMNAVNNGGNVWVRGPRNYNERPNTNKPLSLRSWANESNIGKP